MVTCGPAFSFKKMVKWFGIAQGPHSLETVSYTHLTLPTNREV